MIQVKSWDGVSKGDSILSTPQTSCRETEAAVVTFQEGATTATTAIGTIYGPGLPGHITVAGGSTEPVVSASTSQGKGSQVFLIVEDDEDIVEIGSAQGFTQLVEPKKEKTDPPSTMPHTSIGHGVGGGAS